MGARVVAFVGIGLSVVVSRSVVTQPADSRERDDHPMTWEQFTDVLPILTLALGYAGSQFSDRLRERHERERIVLQRAADVEGEALLELQDLLIDLPDKWLDHLDRWHRHDAEQGALDGDEAYEAAVRIGRPWRRATLLASRIMDDALRTTVQATIKLAYPFHLREVTLMLSGDPHDYDDYPYDEALAAVDDATEAIGGRLRQSPTHRRRA